MPGPGGRSGGFRGGSGGGFRGGSSFRGSSSRPSGGFSSRPSSSFTPRPPMGGGFHRPVRPIFVGGFGPRRSVGGGCGSGCLVYIILLIFILMLAVYLFAGTDSASAEITSGGKTLIYDEEDFQSYADEVYFDTFSPHGAYENHMLLVMLTNDECDDYFAIAWVGDNVRSEINAMMGGESELGQAMYDCINATYYAYSLDSDLAAVTEEMARNIESLGLASPFYNNDSSTAVAHLQNETDLDLTEDTVNAALADFQERTGIALVIHVAEMEDVFRTKTAFGSIFNSGALPIVLIAVVVVAALIIRKKSRKTTEE